MVEKTKVANGYIAVSDAEYRKFNEQFKGEVADKPVKFPKGLGAEHPFDFALLEKAYENFGLVTGIVNKTTDAIVGDFTVKAQNANSQAIIDSFIADTNFLVVIREWIREGILKGNGFIEIDLEDEKMRVLNANNMFVKRTKKGKVIKYNQFTKPFKMFTNTDSTDVVEFKPDQIAHLLINKIPNRAYGIGEIWPNMKTLDNIASNNIDLTKIMSRKAGAPIHVRLGVNGEKVQQKDVDDFKALLQFMNNSTEWVTDANVEMKPIDFKGVEQSSINVKDSNIEELSAGTQIPVVLLGRGNVAEGLAKEQGKGFTRNVTTKQTVIESVIEEKIFRPLLRKNGLDEKIVFIWNLPSEEDKNERLGKIGEKLKDPFISQTLKAGLEIEYARLLDLKDTLDNLETPAEASAREEKERKELDRERRREETEIQQPEVPGAKPNANQKAQPKKLVKEKKVREKGCMHGGGCGQQLTESQTSQMTLREFINIQELAGFNYSDYLIKILAALKVDKFEQLRALDESQIGQGLLTQNDIKKLKLILRDGFRKNKTIRQIQRDIEGSIELKDRVNEEGKLIISGGNRANGITRTETVRLANIGLKDLYQENGITSVRFLSALSDRTCPICEELNGQVFTLKELEIGTSQPPIHTSCRCSLVSLT